MIIKNTLGWEDELTGIQIAYSEKFAFMNICRNPKFRLPIWKEVKQHNPTEK